MTLTLWHAPPSRSVRVFWLLTELGVPFEAKTFDFFKEDEWKPVVPHPLKSIPVLQDGDLTLWESGACMEYILQKYGKGRLQPAPDSPLYAEYLKWLWFFEATFDENMLIMLRHVAIYPEEDRVPKIAAKTGAAFAQHLDLIDAALGDKEYLVGDSFTAADIMLARELYLVVNFAKAVSPEKHPKLYAYYERLSELPAFKASYVI